MDASQQKPEPRAASEGSQAFPGPAVNPSLGAWVRHPCLTQSRKGLTPLARETPLPPSLASTLASYPYMKVLIRQTAENA